MYRHIHISLCSFRSKILLVTIVIEDMKRFDDRYLVQLRIYPYVKGLCVNANKDSSLVAINPLYLFGILEQANEHLENCKKSNESYVILFFNNELNMNCYDSMDNIKNHKNHTNYYKNKAKIQIDPLGTVDDAFPKDIHLYKDTYEKS